MMNKLKRRAAAFLLLLILPLSLFAQGAVTGAPKSDSMPRFSLAIRYAPAVPRIAAARAVFLASVPSDSPAPKVLSFGSWSRDFLKDAGEIWSFPLHIRTRDIVPIAGLAVLTGVLIANDEAIRRDMLDYQMNHAWVKAISPVITEMGSFGAFGTAAAFLFYGLIAKDDKSVETAVLASSAMLQSGILVTFLKGIFGRQRPFWDNGNDRWSGPVGFFSRFGAGQLGRYDSFPGGHSITAWSLATVIAMQYHESVWVPILAYTTATGVALSRVTEGKHWLSDCLVGSVLGYVIGRMVVLNHHSRY